MIQMKPYLYSMPINPYEPPNEEASILDVEKRGMNYWKAVGYLLLACCLPRLEVNAQCTLPVFERLVRTGYASAAGQYRARLRDALFHFPVVKDALRQVLGRFIN